MTVTRRIRRRGEHAISRKTIARGMPVDPSEPVVTTLVCFVLFRTRGCGCSGHPAFPAPSVGRKFHAQLGRIAPRDRGVAPHYSSSPRTRLCENSDVELARRISVSISSLWKTDCTGNFCYEKAIEKTILRVLGK